MERTSHRKAIIVVPIKGLQDGTRAFEDTVPAKAIAGIVSEIDGEVHIAGQVTRIGRRFRVKVSISAVAHLICDRSLEDYDEPITTEAAYEFILDSELAHEQAGELLDPEVVRGLNADATEINITEDVRQEIALAIPMKRVAPKYRTVELDEILKMKDVVVKPEDVPDTTGPWEALKKLKQS